MFETMLASMIVAQLAGLSVALPPPLCRGRAVSRYDPRLDADPSARATAEVQAAYEALCPKKDCGGGKLFENATIGNNAATWVSGLGQGNNTTVKIVYSRRFLNALNDSFGPGASFGVLAHEVGHGLTAAMGLRVQGESNWDEELRADYFAGCALGRAGRTPDEMENALRALASNSTSSHPSFAKRNPVVRRGFQDCSAKSAAKKKKAFGLGSLVEGKKDDGCFHYPFRLRSEVEQVGPVAAALRQSRGFASKEACEAHRASRTKSSERLAEPCACLR